MIVELLFKQNLQCRTEDQMVLISFLGEMNDSYNKVKLGERFAGAFGKRRECVASQAAADDARFVKSVNDGKIPAVTPATSRELLEKLFYIAEFKSAIGDEFGKHQKAGAVGYVALGGPAGSEDFVNFDLLNAKRTLNNGVPDGSIMMANAPVNLRANLEALRRAAIRSSARLWNTSASRQSTTSPIIAVRPGPWSNSPNARTAKEKRKVAASKH